MSLCLILSELYNLLDFFSATILLSYRQFTVTKALLVKKKRMLEISKQSE